MEKKRAYCPTCKADVAFVSRTRQDQRQRDGRSYCFRKPIALCPKCGRELEYEPYIRTADEAFERVFSSTEGLITPEQIHEIPRKYAIGKRPLSRLLGWGELTYTRLMDGDIPTADHSAELLELLDDPAAFAQLLQRGYERGSITQTAFKRSMRAVGGIMGNDVYAMIRVSAAADRLCVLAEGNLTPSALHSLLYYVHGLSIITFDAPLFKSQPVAAPNGPEYPHIRKGYSFDDIQATYAHAKQRAESRMNASEGGAVLGTAAAAGEETGTPPHGPFSDLGSDSAEGASPTPPEAPVTPVEVAALFDKADAIKAKKGKKSKKWRKAQKAAEDAAKLLEEHREALSAFLEEQAQSEETAAGAAKGSSNTEDATAQPEPASHEPKPEGQAGQPAASGKDDKTMLADSPVALAGLRSVLSAPEEALIDKVYAHYGQMSGQVLARHARMEAPWQDARARALSTGDNPDSAVITHDALRTHFSKLNSPRQ